MAKCRASYGLGLACFAIAMAMAGATQFTVGGANGWSVPPAGTESLNAWAMKNRFQIGDKLVFVYPSDQDSVLLVEPSDYNACNTSSYVKKFTDGDTVLTLDHSGAYFFISGVEANCRANEKLIVMVLAAGRNGTDGAPVPSTAPSSSPPPAPSTAPPPSSPPSASSSSSSSSSPPPPSSPAPNSPTTASPPPPASAPTTPPASSSPPSTPPSTPPSAPAGAPPPPPPPSASSPSPGTHGNGTTTNSTGTPPPSAGSNHRNGAALTVSAGLVSSAGACIIGFAMLAL